MQGRVKIERHNLGLFILCGPKIHSLWIVHSSLFISYSIVIRGRIYYSSTFLIKNFIYKYLKYFTPQIISYKLWRKYNFDNITFYDIVSWTCEICFVYFYYSPNWKLWYRQRKFLESLLIYMKSIINITLQANEKTQKLLVILICFDWIYKCLLIFL